MKKQNGQPQERKAFPATVIEVDEKQGIVDAIVSVFGTVDDGDDRIWPGAFVKTISERMGRIRVLDNHNAYSINDVIAKPVFMREVDASALPDTMRMKYPDVTGGLQVKMQFDREIENSWDAFKRIKNGFITEYSIGYDAFDVDFTTEGEGEEKRQIRNLRSCRLWDTSPVVWGMNSATATVDVKNADGEIVEPPPSDDRPVIDTAEETKAGRMISAVNAARIVAAYEALQATMIDAGLLAGVDEPEETEGEKVALLESEKKEIESPAEQSEAGPLHAPTDVEFMQKTIDIELALLENQKIQRQIEQRRNRS